jgi:hypothetical protein
MAVEAEGSPVMDVTDVEIQDDANEAKTLNNVMCQVDLSDELINMSFDREERNSEVSSLQEPETEPAGATLEMERLQVLITTLMSWDNTLDFSQPVDLQQHPNYLEEISKINGKPIDLGTILKYLIEGHYGTILEFQADVNMTFNNAMVYYRRKHPIYKKAKTLKKKFEKGMLTTLRELVNLV